MIKSEDRWKGIIRDWRPDDIKRLRGSTDIKYTLASCGANKLWKLINQEDDWVAALGALTGNQAIQQVRAGLKAIYLSGWQVAADAICLATCIRTRAFIRQTAFRRLLKE